MSEEKKPFLIINEEYDEIQINIKHTKPYMKLQQENKKYKEVIDKAIEYINSKVISNGEIIDQLRKIEVKELLQILDKAKN